MRRRTILKLCGAASLVVGAGVTGCGGGDGRPFAKITGTTRAVNYDAEGNRTEYSSRENWVKYFNASGQEQWKFDGVGTLVGSLNAPSGATAVGEQIFVSDYANHRVIVLNRQGVLQFSFGRFGHDQDALFFVHEPVPGPDGHMYFCDALHHRIQVYTRNGQWVRSIGRFGAGGSGLNYPESLAFDSSGNLHVVDSGNARVVVYSMTADLLRTYGSRGAARGQMINPEGIAIDRDDRVYVADKGQHMVHAFDSRGGFIDRFPVSLPSGDFLVPGEMRWAPDGTLMVSGIRDASQGRIPRSFL